MKDNTDKAREALCEFNKIPWDSNNLPESAEARCWISNHKETIREALQPKAVDLDIVCGMYDDFYQWARSKEYKFPVIASEFNSVIQWLNLKGHLYPVPDGYVCKKQLIEKLRGMNHIDLKVGGATQRAFGQNEGYNQAIDTIIAELENEDE